jgi:hypothetical protein
VGGLGVGISWLVLKLGYSRACGRLCLSGVQSGTIHALRLGVVRVSCLEFGPPFTSTCRFGCCVLYVFRRPISCCDFCAASPVLYLQNPSHVLSRQNWFWEDFALFCYADTGFVVGVVSRQLGLIVVGFNKVASNWISLPDPTFSLFPSP